MRNRIPLLLSIISLIPGLANAQEIGPANGHLVIVGGAAQDSEIFEQFVDLAGGVNARIVVIPTAGGGEEYDKYWPGLRPFRNVGANHLTVLHTNDRDVANSDDFVNVIQNADGVWFGGGRQWRLADSYLDTATHEALWDLLDRGGVIGGSSAGATIQGSYLARGDTRTNTVMMGDHEVGMGFLKNSAIDQHLLARNRQFDLIEIIEAKPELLGIGIDENTAIVVTGDRFEVIGSGYVAIYDSNRMIDSGGQFYLLAPGDMYDLKERQGMRRGTEWNPIGRVVEKSWKDN